MGVGLPRRRSVFPVACLWCGARVSPCGFHNGARVGVLAGGCERVGRVSASPPFCLFLPRVWFLARLCYDGGVAVIFVW